MRNILRLETRLYPIHTFQNPVLHQLIVAVETTTSWITNWKTSERVTGNERIDTLTTSDNFHVKMSTR